MGSIMKSLGFAAIAAALSIGMVACQGQSTTSPAYLPTGATGLSMPQTAGGLGSESKESKIVSSCGFRIHIIVAGIVGCKFHEKGYKNRLFTLENQTHGLVLISPSKGNRFKRFTIAGVAFGSGHFVVRDRIGNALKVVVRVTLHS